MVAERAKPVHLRRQLQGQQEVKGVDLGEQRPFAPDVREERSLLAPNDATTLPKSLEVSTLKTGIAEVSRRPDAAQCLEHAWFKKFEAAPPPLSVGITQCLEAYAGQPELKKAVFLLIAHMCTAPALSELRAIFTHFDTLNQGSLVTSDFRDVLYKSGMTSLQVERIVHALDQEHPNCGFKRMCQCR